MSGVVPPPRTPHVARSGSVSAPAAQAGSLPRATGVAPFMPPPPCEAVLFHSPALRYSMADALAVPPVRQQAAGGESTVVFQPLQGGSMMFDLSAGSVLIEDYSAPPPHTHTPVGRSSANQSAPPTVASTAATASASASASSSSTQSTTTRVFSSMFSSFSSLFGQTTLGLLTGSARQRSTSASQSSPTGKGAPSATERSVSPSRSPSLSSSPAMSASSSPPASAAQPGVATAGETALELSEEEESSGFSASGPCIITVARSFVPLPTDAHALASYYDPVLTARGALWIQQLNPMMLRRQFAPGLYLRLLGARPAASAGGTATDGSSDGNGGGGDEDEDEAPVQSPGESHVEVYIRKDLARTFPQQALFASRYGLSVLFNVLRAFAHFDPAVSYSQGMAFIVGVLMLHYGPPDRRPPGGAAATAAGAEELDPSSSSAASAPVLVPDTGSNPASADDIAVVPSSSSSSSAVAASASAQPNGGESEELLFFSLVQLMSDRKHNLRSLYSDDCVGLRLILSVFGAALEESDPALSSHLRAQGVDASLYATPWFVSCFAYRFSLPFTSACFGHFVNIGLYFLVLCALHVLRHLRTALLAKPFELLVPFLTMGALPDLPADLPDQAFAQGSLPDHLMQRLQPKHTRQSSYKVGRGRGGKGRGAIVARQRGA